MSIKDNFSNIKKLYHYTSFDTACNILESMCLRYGRLNNMNDIHENDKVVYKDAQGNDITNFDYSILDCIYNEMYMYRQISLTMDDSEKGKLGFDLHQMWGLYADKGLGVCLVFDKQNLLDCIGSNAISAT